MDVVRDLKGFGDGFQLLVEDATVEKAVPRVREYGIHPATGIGIPGEWSFTALLAKDTDQVGGFPIDWNHPLGAELPEGNTEGVAPVGSLRHAAHLEAAELPDAQARLARQEESQAEKAAFAPESLHQEGVDVGWEGLW